MFSKFDLKKYEDHDKNSDYIRQYGCPAPDCSFTANRPHIIYKHINSKQHNTSELTQDTQHVIYQGKEMQSFRVIIRADELPDYIPCKPRTDTVTAAHMAHVTAEEDGGGSCSKRQRKQTELYRPAAAQPKQPNKATAAKAAATAAADNSQTELFREVKEAYGTAMETNKKMHDLQLAHAETLHKQAAAHTDKVHAMAIAAAKQDTKTKILEADLANERKFAKFYTRTCIPLLTRLAATAPVGNAADPSMDGYLET